MSIPTPAPALTDEQMGSSPADDAQIDDDVRALVEGESMPEETAWAIIAAVVARAKREALRDVKQAVEGGFPPYGSELRFDGSEDRELAAYGSGMRDALSLALGTGGRI